MVKSSDTFNNIVEKIKELKRDNDELVMEVEAMKRQALYLRNEIKKRDFSLDEFVTEVGSMKRQELYLRNEVKKRDLRIEVLEKYKDDFIKKMEDQERMIVNLETYNDDLVTGNLELNRELFKAQKEKDFYRQAYMKLFWKYTGMSD